MDYMTTKQVAQLWRITTRQVQAKCDSGQIEGVIRIGRMWFIPIDASKPIDRRTKAAKSKKG